MNDATLWAVIPAAGGGRRMQAAISKQYLPFIDNCTLMQCTLERLLQFGLSRLILAVSPDDEAWSKVLSSMPESAVKNIRVIKSGGVERAHTVLQTLQAIEYEAQPQDLVLVHDLARPCLTATDLEAVVAAARSSSHGAILASPLADTLKRARPNEGEPAGAVIDCTVPRTDLWRALTPQVFRYQELKEALANADLSEVTDEASAIELAGGTVQLVAGRSDNIKVTVASDLLLAAYIYRQQMVQRQ